MPKLLSHTAARLYLGPIGCELQQLVGYMQAPGQLHGLQLGKSREADASISNMLCIQVPACRVSSGRI